MFVIRLPNGNLMAPESAMDEVGQMTGDAYVEISPDDPQYPRLAAEAVSEEEVHARRQRWRDGDEELRREFQRHLAAQDAPDSPGG